MESRSLIESITLANELAQQGRVDDAVSIYQTWLESCDVQPEWKHAAYFNIGVLLSGAGRYEESLAAYRNALHEKPDFYQASINMGLALEAKGKSLEAIGTWEQALQPSEAQTMLLNHIGRVFENSKILDKAEYYYRRSLSLMNNQPKVIHHYVHVRQKQCVWPLIEPFLDVTEQSLLDYSGPMSVLAMSDDPAVQHKAVTSWVERNVPRDLPRLSPSEGYDHPRLKIGYLSCDFRWHPVSILTAEIFELHERAGFEVFGFDYTPADDGAMRQRVVSAMDHHIPLNSLSDEDAAKLIRSHEIDILIDLTGLTSGARPAILRYKPAPVQISYLGFVGTSGMREVDYVIADRFVFPEELRAHFVEKPLYLPDVYQSNDTQRAIGEKPSRASCGLPESGFVYCSFNGSYKITPEVFKLWMNILKRSPESVLWLVADNESAQKNLQREAVRHGVDWTRLIFAERVSPADYLARLQVADLMLDTSPYNAGTTASDALWAGLPILTCPGRTYVSRMAGSLLMAAGMPEFIAADWIAYEEMAVELARDSERMRELRQRLQHSIRAAPLFDSRRFVRNLEKAFRSVAKCPDSPVRKSRHDVSVELVSATRMSEQDFWDHSALGMSIKRLRSEKRISYHIFYQNQKGLGEVYNERITSSDGGDIIAFIHDDVWIDDYYLVDRLIDGLSEYDLLGVVGNKRRVDFQPSWAYIPSENGLRLDDPVNFSGFSANGKRPFAEIDFFGQAPAECELLDGLFLAAYKGNLAANGVLFDPAFDFHFYDLDFCRSARKLGLRLGTWQICLTHQSMGELGTESWKAGMQKYFAKWGR